MSEPLLIPVLCNVLYFRFLRPVTAQFISLISRLELLIHLKRPAFQPLLLIGGLKRSTFKSLPRIWRKALIFVYWALIGCFQWFLIGWRSISWPVIGGNFLRLTVSSRVRFLVTVFAWTFWFLTRFLVRLCWYLFNSKVKKLLSFNGFIFWQECQLSITKGRRFHFSLELSY